MKLLTTNYQTYPTSHHRTLVGIDLQRINVSFLRNFHDEDGSKFVSKKSYTVFMNTRIFSCYVTG